MNILGGEACTSIATLSWLFGAAIGAVFDITLIVATALTPRLREHYGQATPPRRTVWRFLPPAAIVAIWAYGAYRAGSQMLLCYTLGSAVIASCVLSVALILAMVTAANDIARRSLW